MRTRLSRAASAIAIIAATATLAPASAQQPQPKPKPPASQKSAAPPKAAAPALVGTWAGTVGQTGSKSYSIALTLTAQGGETDYPELNCGGKLTRVGSAGGFTFYLETITRGGIKQGGRCIDGSITVIASGDKLAWGWVGVHENRTIVAQSTLARR